MTDQKAAGEVEAKAEAACLAWMRECNEDSATGDEMRAFEAGYEAACHQRDQRIAELEAEVAADLDIINSALDYDTHPSAVLALQRVQDRIEAALGLKG